MFLERERESWNEKERESFGVGGREIGLDRGEEETAASQCRSPENR